MIIARWINEDRTEYVMLSNDGSISVANRSASYEVWGPPRKLTLEDAHPSTHDFITTCIKQSTVHRSELGERVDVDSEDRSVKGRTL